MAPLQGSTSAGKAECEATLPSSTKPGPASSREELIAYRRHAVHTIGNLTLHTRALGTSLGNGSYDTKRAEFTKHIQLQITKPMTEPGKDGWDEGAIRKRSAWLFEQAKKAWPAPG
ncbi:HNH endonuclease family protein [Sediminicoccus rosea]|uniref:HNH endonuclease family protein n=1 Tax=Sediminicoccus rosea TaxID=1225128 RepID=UPI00384FBD15